jgi:uncharacterized membrane protein
MHEHSVSHSAAKTFTYFVVDSLLTGAVSLAVTRETGTALTIAAGVQVTEIALYYFHERVWARFINRKH